MREQQRWHVDDDEARNSNYNALTVAFVSFVSLPRR